MVTGEFNARMKVLPMKKAHIVAGSLLASFAFGLGAPSLAAVSEIATLTTQDENLLRDLGMVDNPAVSWSDVTTQGDTYIFSDFVQTMSEGQLSAQTVVVEGLRPGTDVPVFDAVRFADGTVIHEGEVIGRFDMFSADVSGEAFATRWRSALQGNEIESLLDYGGSVREMRVEGLQFEGSASAEDGGGDFILGVDQISFEDRDGDGFASMSLSNLGFTADDPETGTPLVFSIETIQGTQVLMDSLLNGSDPSSFDPELMFAKTYDSFDMTNLLMEVGGLRFAIPSATSSIQEIAGGALRTTFDMPRFSMVVDAASDPQAAQVAGSLAMLGYENIDLSYTSSYVFDPAADRLYSDGPSAFTLREGGTIDTRFDMTGISAYVESMMAVQAEAEAEAEGGMASPIDEAQMLEIFNALSVTEFSFSFEDAGLLDRGLALFAAQSGVDVETARMQAAGLVALGTMQANEVLPPAVVSQMSQAVMGFIQNGGTITVSVNPPEPVGVMGMIDPSGGFNAEAAGLSFSHEAP